MNKRTIFLLIGGIFSQHRPAVATVDKKLTKHNVMKHPERIPVKMTGLMGNKRTEKRTGMRNIMGRAEHVFFKNSLVLKQEAFRNDYLVLNIHKPAGFFVGNSNTQSHEQYRTKSIFKHFANP